MQCAGNKFSDLCLLHSEFQRKMQYDLGDVGTNEAQKSSVTMEIII